ncbi:hypothetical protein BgiBS90_022351 [Biomphalaria glabrata]|nr:hypothetical protein BgiBS90_022351 [Biomphalaria glabrata]
MTHPPKIRITFSTRDRPRDLDLNYYFFGNPEFKGRPKVLNEPSANTKTTFGFFPVESLRRYGFLISLSEKGRKSALVFTLISPVILFSITSVFGRAFSKDKEHSWSAQFSEWTKFADPGDLIKGPLNNSKIYWISSLATIVSEISCSFGGGLKIGSSLDGPLDKTGPVINPKLPDQLTSLLILPELCV